MPTKDIQRNLNPERPEKFGLWIFKVEGDPLI